MAKILISLLGTGKSAKNDNNKNNYTTTTYKFENNNKLYRNQQYATNPIIEKYKIDRLFLIGTSESMWDNINEIYSDNDDSDYAYKILEKKENADIDDCFLQPLNDKISKKLPGSECFVVLPGDNQEELWGIFEKFQKIIENLSEQDQLYLDITHLFRSHSIMSLIVAEFGKIRAGFKIKGIFYAMLKKDEASVIIDVSIFYELLSWGQAISNLKNYGNSFELKKLINTNIDDKNISGKFNQLSDAISISDMRSLQKSINSLSQTIDNFKTSSNKILPLIASDLEDFFNRFKNQSLPEFQLNLSKWYHENKNFSMAYMCLAEASVSIMCKKEKLDDTNKDNRKEAKDILFSWSDYKNNKKLSTKEIEIGKTFKKINNIRNNIAHNLPASNSSSKSSPNDSIKNLDDYIKVIAEWL